MKIVKTIICRRWEHKFIAAQILHYADWYDEFWITETNYTVKGIYKNYIFDSNELGLPQSYMEKIKYIKIDSSNKVVRPEEGAPINSFQFNQRLFRGQFIEYVDNRALSKSILLSVDCDEFVDLESLSRDSQWFYPMKCYRLNNFMFKPYLWEDNCTYFGPTLISGSFYSSSLGVFLLKLLTILYYLIFSRSILNLSLFRILTFVKRNFYFCFSKNDKLHHWRYEGVEGLNAEGSHFSWHCSRDNLIDKFQNSTGHSSSCVSSTSLEKLDLIEKSINPFSGQSLVDIRKYPGPKLSSALFKFYSES